MKGIFRSKRLEQAMHRSLSATSLYPSNYFAFQQGWHAACKFLERVYNAEEICCQCGKLLYEGDNYFIYDEVGCFCEKCMNKIEKESKKMNNKLIQCTESDCNFIRFFIKAQIIAKGTEHPSCYRVEIFDKVDIFSLTPYLDRNIVCLLCKLQGGAIVSIPVEWLQIMEE